MGDNLSPAEKEIEKVLRPSLFDDFAAEKDHREPESIRSSSKTKGGARWIMSCLHGPPGLGKTTLSYIIANELACEYKKISGPVLDKPGDLAGLLTDLKK